MKFSERIRMFMKGRYGADELYNFLFIVYFLLMILNTFLKSNIVRVLELIILVVMFYRFFSKKIYVRNQKFKRLKNSLIKPFKNLKRKFKDKEHVYKKCQKCKTILKLPLPRKRGFNKAVCPHCKSKVRLFTLKKEKIEIVKASKVK